MALILEGGEVVAADVDGDDEEAAFAEGFAAVFSLGCGCQCFTNFYSLM